MTHVTCMLAAKNQDLLRNSVIEYGLPLPFYILHAGDTALLRFSGCFPSERCQGNLCDTPFPCSSKKSCNWLLSFRSTSAER